METTPRWYLRLQYGRTSILFTGDIESPVEDRLDSTYGEFLRCNLLKVPHHGAGTGCTEGFLRRVLPDHAVISVGLRQQILPSL